MNLGLNTSQLSVGYGDHMVINHMNLNIPIGKITSIIGPNGCGKSTLLKSIGRIIPKKNGIILLNGKNIHEMPTKILAKELAILPQSPISPEGITVKELIAYGRYPHQNKSGKLSAQDKKIIDWAICVTNLETIKNRKMDNLSGGQKQRVWIALALAQETDIIFLDEPTTYLDMAYQLEIMELLEQLNKKHHCTIVMVLHDLNLASKFSDYMIALKSGHIMCTGSPLEVMTQENLKNVYDIAANIMIEPKSQTPICISYELLKQESNALSA